MLDVLIGLINFLEQCKVRCKVLIISIIKKFSSLAFTFYSLKHHIGVLRLTINFLKLLDTFPLDKDVYFLPNKIVSKSNFYIFSHKLYSFHEEQHLDNSSYLMLLHRSFLAFLACYAKQHYMTWLHLLYHTRTIW